MALTGGLVLWILGGTLVASLCLLVRHRGWLRVPFAAAVLILLPAMAAAVINDHFQYWMSWRDLTGLHSRDLTTLSLDRLEAEHAGWLPARGQQGTSTMGVPTPGQPEHGRLVKVRIRGTRSKITRGGLIYLPPQYFSPAWRHVTFPVVELLHGSPGIPGDWINSLHADLAADIASGRAGTGPVVLVIPDTNGSRFTDRECQDSRRGQDETYLTFDVRDWVTARLHVRADRNGWVLAGYSTGGYCAVNLLDHHPELFAGAASLDGYFRAIQDRYTGDLYGQSRWLRQHNDPSRQWADHPPAPASSLLLLAGQRDDSLDETKRFAGDVRSHSEVRVDVHLGIQAGAGHNFSSWRTMLPTVYAWAWTVLQTSETNGLLHHRESPRLPDTVELAPPGCQTPNGGLRHVAVCKGHHGQHWYRLSTDNKRTESLGASG